MEYKQSPKVVDPILDKLKSAASDFLGYGASLGSSLFQNYLSQKNARDQRDWQEKMWHMQNAYNTPVAMKERMLAAGLNPYQMTGAEPAASAGTGAMASTPQLPDPLDSVKKLAEVKNINAATAKTQSENDKILQETINLKIAERLGLVDAEQAEAQWRELSQLYGTSRSPVELSTQETESRISDNRASAIAHMSDAQLNDELAEDSRVLRDGRKDLLSAQNDDYRSQIQRRIEQTAIDYALVKVQQEVGKSQFFLNQAMTENQRRDFSEKVRTFDARKTALDIGNQLGLTEVALKEYADAVNDAWKTVMSGNPFKNPLDFFDAISTVYADTLRSITGNVSTFVPLDPSKNPTPRTRKNGYK
ncbi:MAG: hypothetical protein E7126_06120 [Rikenellaceae bacterium]|nr:hypothetical protein [Rikenellaceae bacterium]